MHELSFKKTRLIHLELRFCHIYGVFRGWCLLIILMSDLEGENKSVNINAVKLNFNALML